jgi:predicted DCC family thiol-disulfide oxidoreductase YuxK
MGLTRPLFLFDGDCTFCTSCARLLERIGPRAAVIPWQLTDLEPLGITPVQAQEAVQWLGTDGSVRSGHEAIAAALASAGLPWSVLARALLLPGISALAALGYRLVAANRSHLSRIFRRLSGTT